jgi:hypothetical protein
MYQNTLKQQVHWQLNTYDLEKKTFSLFTLVSGCLLIEYQAYLNSTFLSSFGFGLFADNACLPQNPGNHNAINDYLWHSPTSMFAIEYMMAI